MGPLLSSGAPARMDLNRALIARRKGGDGRDKMSFFRGGRESFSSVQCFSDVLPNSGSGGSAYQPQGAKTATARHFAGNEVSGKLTCGRGGSSAPCLV